MKRPTTIEMISVSFCIILLILFFKTCNRPATYIDRVEIRETHDTIVDYSVVTILTPVLHTERIVDTVFYPVTVFDTTVSVPLPVTEYYYTDTNYQAWITGIDCRLDSLKYREKNTTITHTIETTIHHFQKFGLMAGAEVGYNVRTKRPSLSPQIGFEIKENNFLIGYDVLNQEPKISYLYKFFKK